MQKIAHSITWLMLQRIVELAIRFFVGAWLVRYLGPRQFGIYSYAVSFVAIFADFAALGLDKIVVRDLTRGSLHSGKILGTALALRALAAIVTAGMVVFVATLAEDDPQVRKAIWILSVQLLFSPAMVVDLWFQSQVDSRYVVLIRTAVTLAVAVVQVAFILAGLHLQAFLVLTWFSLVSWRWGSCSASDGRPAGDSVASKPALGHGNGSRLMAFAACGSLRIHLHADRPGNARKVGRHRSGRSLRSGRESF